MNHPDTTTAIADREWGLDLPAPPAREPTVANWVEEFKLFKFPRLAPNTRLLIDRHLRALALWIGPRKLTHQLLIQFCNEQKARRDIEQTTLSTSLSTVKQFLRWCENMGYIEGKLAFLVPSIMAVLPPPKRFSSEQYVALKESTKGTVWYYASVMAYRTGMRLSDVCMIKWENVDLTNLVITYVPFKTRRKGRVAVCPIEVGGDLHEVLLDMDKSRSTHPMWGAYVCPSLAMYYPKDACRSPAMAGDSSKGAFKSHCKEAGAGDLSFHKLRNAFMSRMVDAELSWPRACQITGLTTFSVFLRYAKPDVNALRRDMEKMSRLEAEQMAGSMKILPQQPAQKLIEDRYDD